MVSVTTDGHKVNAAFQAKLGVNVGKPWFINPFAKDKEARIYVIYDSVHLWKNVFYQLLNNKTLSAPPFPFNEVSKHFITKHENIE